MVNGWLGCIFVGVFSVRLRWWFLLLSGRCNILIVCFGVVEWDLLLGCIISVFKYRLWWF